MFYLFTITIIILYGNIEMAQGYTNMALYSYKTLVEKNLSKQ